MCHQAIEKAFKSVIAKSGVLPPKIHGLIRLAELWKLAPLLDAEVKTSQI